MHSKKRILAKKLLSFKAKNNPSLIKKESELNKGQVVNAETISEKTKLDFKIYAKDKYRREMYSPILSKIKIVAYTSLSPSHHNIHNQLDAVESWNKLGIEIYSLNHASELLSLKKMYPSYINFIDCSKTTKHIFGKPCILISEMMNHFRENKIGDILMLINSDIILNMPSDLFKRIKSISDIGIMIASRNDYKEGFNENKKYVFGFDVFCIHKKFIPIFPTAMYSMGQTWWDYWVPYIALRNKVPIFMIEEAFAFHKEHPIQYNAKDWIKMTEYFKWENNIVENNHQKITDNIRNEIINNSISFKL